MSKDSEYSDQVYAGREQTLVKHSVLKKYLEAFAHIIGFRFKAISYVDCFAGPWDHRSPDYSDTSFSIAVRELRRAAQTHAKRNHALAIRCMFLERDPEAFAKLERFARSNTDATIKVQNAAFEDSIDDILNFVRQGGHGAFPFFFVDPWGYKDIAPETIRPLLRMNPGEVLINFMTGHIARFVSTLDPANREHFDRLFGGEEFRESIRGKTGRDREDSLVRSYMNAIGDAGRFDYVCAAVVLAPDKNRVHNHLIYATRNFRGVEEFKKAEKTATRTMGRARFHAHQRKSVGGTGQGILDFGDDFAPTGGDIDKLRNHYLGEADSTVRQLLQERRRVRYQKLLYEALRYPLVWECDVKSWIEDWRERAFIALEGLAPKEKVPKAYKRHYVKLIVDF